MLAVEHNLPPDFDKIILGEGATAPMPPGSDDPKSAMFPMII